MNYTELRKAISKTNTESLNVEFKQQIPSPAKFARSIAAIANTTSGGLLYIGVDEDNEDRAVIKGVPYDKKIHNKDRIVNILADRIQPNIARLEIQVVRIRRKNTCVFVISVPSTPAIYGVKKNKIWRYYIRRAVRTEELTPVELLQLANVKQDYRDNMKTRDALLSTATAMKAGFADLLNMTSNDLQQCLTDRARFRKALLNVKMKNLSMNFLDGFYFLKDEMESALKIPNGGLTTEEHEYIQDIQRVIEEFAPSIISNSESSVLSLDEHSMYYNLSVVEWVKNALNLHPAKEKLWNELRPDFSSYEIAYKAFLDKMHTLGVAFDEYYETQWSTHLHRALLKMSEKLNRLINHLETMQSKFGTFKTE